MVCNIAAFLLQCHESDDLRAEELCDIKGAVPSREAVCGEEDTRERGGRCGASEEHAAAVLMCGLRGDKEFEFQYDGLRFGVADEVEGKALNVWGACSL